MFNDNVRLEALEDNGNDTDDEDDNYEKESLRTDYTTKK